MNIQNFINHGVVNDIHDNGIVIVNSDRAQTATRQKEEIAILDEVTDAECDNKNNALANFPKELQTEEAMAVLDKLKNADLLTEDYKPKGNMSLTEKALLAGMISGEIFNKNYWVPFQKYWGMNNLSSLNNKANNQKKSGEFIEKIKNALKN